jgi:hypothetical protein
MMNDIMTQLTRRCECDVTMGRICFCSGLWQQYHKRDRGNVIWHTKLLLASFTKNDSDDRELLAKCAFLASACQAIQMKTLDILNPGFGRTIFPYPDWLFILPFFWSGCSGTNRRPPNWSDCFALIVLGFRSLLLPFLMMIYQRHNVGGSRRLIVQASGRQSASSTADTISVQFSLYRIFCI